MILLGLTCYVDTLEGNNGMGIDSRNLYVWCFLTDDGYILISALEKMVQFCFKVRGNCLISATRKFEL